MKRESGSSRKWPAWLGGAAMGAAAMYFSDPDRGRRRRALMQDQLRHLRTEAGSATGAALRDLGHRLDGMRSRAGRLMSPSRGGRPADDPILLARVRARLGHVTANSGAVSIAAEHGRIILSGPVLAAEKDRLISCVRDIRGVAAVEDRMHVHERPDGIPGLQGNMGASTAGARSAPPHENWTPAQRGRALLAGGVIGGYGLARRTPAGLALAALGLTLFARGLMNTAVRHAGSHAIDVQKSINIMASPEAVFDAWTDYENFPRFMSHVRQVSDLGGGRSHWIVEGPAGTPVEWNARLTESRRPSSLSWQSEPDTTVEHAGSVRFEPDVDGGTRVSVRLSYRPPAGALGHGIAVLLGSDPERRLDDDLMRMKNFIESGARPRDAAAPATATSQSLH